MDLLNIQGTHWIKNRAKKYEKLTGQIYKELSEQRTVQGTY